MKTVIEMACEAGLRSALLLRLYGKTEALCESELEELEQIKHFAELVTEQANARANNSWALMCKKMVAAEREACAKLCETTAPSQINGYECAAAIRARGNT